MRNKVFFITAMLVLLTGHIFNADSNETNNQSKYVLGPGDIIEISVWNHPELTKIINVRPDGWINFLLAGELYAVGISPGALAEQIRQKLLQYMKNPKVSVSVVEYKSKKVLVLGAVKKPGLYQYEGGMTTFDAIGEAEGYTKHAELKSILVIRNAYSKYPEFHLANLYTVIHDGIGAGDVILEPKDIVYVPQNFIGNLGDFMDYFISRIRPAADTYLIYKISNK